MISPRNTPEAHHRLLRQTNTRHVYTSEASTRVCDIAQECGLQVHTFPTCNEALWPDAPVPYPPEAEFGKIADDPFLILHTSASTNYPQPITWTHRTIAIADNFHLLPEINGEKVLRLEHRPGLRLFLGYPLFHAAGWNQLAYSVYFGSLPIFQPPDVPLSASSLVRILEANLVDAIAVPPIILEEAVQDQHFMEHVSQLQYIGYGGAPLSARVGNSICLKTRLIDMIGTTETGCYPELRVSKQATDWQYHHYHPSLGFEFRPHSDDTYEAVWVHREEYEPFQVAFVTFPSQIEYPTNDLYSKHPTNPRLWLYRGRKDNTIVLSNGEKLQPDEVESILSKHPLIDAGVDHRGVSKSARDAGNGIQWQCSHSGDTSDVTGYGGHCERPSSRTRTA